LDTHNDSWVLKGIEALDHVGGKSVIVEDISGMTSVGSGTSVHGSGCSGGARSRNRRQGEWDGIGMIHVETIELVVKVKEITVGNFVV
jgi:hypothetical protein